MFDQKYKKSALYMAVFITIAVIAASCSLKPVSAIQVIASPEVSLPLGSKEFPDEGTLDDFFKKFLDGKEGKMRVYTYTPPGDTSNQARYLIHYPIQTLDFDLGKNFEKTPLNETFSTEMEIPTVNTTSNQNIDLLLNQKLINSFNEAVQPGSLPIPVPINGTLSDQTLAIHFEEFKTMSFASGSSMIISTASDNNELNYSISKAVMKASSFDSQGTDVEGRITGVGLSAEFDLSEKTIKNEVKIILTVQLWGGGTGNITVKPQFQGRVAEARGVNRTIGPILLDPQMVMLPMNNDFQSAEIKEGSLRLSIAAPQTWKGITITGTTAINQAAAASGPGLSINNHPIQQLENTVIDLAGKKINNEHQLTYSAKLTVRLSNAVYTDRDSLPAVFAVDIKEFSSVTLKNRDNFTKTEPIPVPQEMKAYLESINIESSEVEIKMDNGLPENNPISIEFACPTLNIPSRTNAFPSKTSEPFSRTYTGSATHLSLGNTNAFDVTMKIILPNSDSATDTFTLKNIRPGEKISFSGTTELKLKWTQVVIKQLTNMVNTFPANEEGPLNLSPITKIMKKAKITLDDIPVYFYVGSPLFENQTMNARLELSAIADGKTPKLVDLDRLTLHQLPQDIFTGVEKEYRGSIPPAALTIKQEPGTPRQTLTGILNDYPENLRLQYTLSMNKLTITNEKYTAIASTGNKVQMTVDVLLEVPIGFTIGENGGTIPLEQFNDQYKDRDILGRTAPSNTSQIKKILESVNFTLDLQARFAQTLGIEPTVTVACESKGESLYKKTIKLGGGEPQQLFLTKQEFMDILEAYPVSPRLEVQLPTGHHTLKKGSSIKINLTAVSKAKIDYTIEL